MTTYKTISEAFKNGTGDVFFTKNNEFVAVSRHSIPFEEMEEQGFKFLTYSETLEIATRQDVEENKKAYFTKPTPKQEPKQFINYPDQEAWAYYQEFPDAYGQHL